MNANEVIANRALEHLGKQKGQYEFCSPNDDVNKGQSTNDAYPSSAKIALILMHENLVEAISKLSSAFFEKGREFADVVKMGRTQLQDAVPMTLGQEFNAYGTTIRYDLESVKNAVSKFTSTNLGGTAIGTGIAADKHFSQVVVQELREVTGFPMVLADDLIEASSSVSSMLFFSGILRRVAVKVSKVCNDLRLLASGPRCGLGEINLPPMAPGSSIMPGKVNPVIPEVMNMCCFDTIGNDITVCFGAEAGQLELNVMEPVIIYKLFTSVHVLTKGMNTLRERCISGITANRERCHEMVHNSIGIVTALLPHIGYKKCTEAAAKALKEKRPVADIVVELGYLDRAKVQEHLQPENMCGPTAKKRKV
jgi:aspartate ammonia-lyase